MNLQTAYLERGLTHLSLKQTANKIVRKLQSKGLHHRFDAIAFCGMSGALFAPLLAAKLDKNLFVVRKENEFHNSHSNRIVEGDYDCKDYIIIDDLICTGKTIEYIINKMKYEIRDSRCHGIVLYGEPRFERHYIENSHRLLWFERLGCWCTDPDSEHFINL